MAQLPQAFPTPAPVASASFDFVDIAEGTGTVLYYGFKGRNASSLTELITSDSGTYSEEIEASSDLAGGTWAYDKTFSLPAFNLSRTVYGTALFQIPVARTIGVSTQRWRTSITIDILKNGTSIASVTSANYDEEEGTELKRVFQIPLSITTPTIFRNNDVLAIRIQVSISNIGTGTNSNTGYIGHDPLGRDGVVLTSTNKLTTQMVFRIPFRIVLER